MDEQVKLSQLENELEGKICEINQLKSMLLAEINAMHDNSKAKRHLFANASKLVECVTYTKEVMGLFRAEIMKLPAVLGEQVAGIVVRIKEGYAKQRIGMGAQIDRLRGELAVKTKENRELQQKLDELMREQEKNNEKYVLPNFQQTSTDDVCDRSPAIEYPAGFRLDTIAEDDEIIVMLDEYKNKCKVRQSQNKNILKTEPPQDNVKIVPSIHERSISYRKIDVKPRSRCYIEDFRHIVEGNVKCPNPNFFEFTTTVSNTQNIQMSHSKISDSKSFASDVSSQYAASIKTEHSKKHSFQQSREVAPPHVIELGGGMRRSFNNPELRRQSKQKIQVTQKERLKSELSDKDCNVILNRPPSKQKIKMTLKEQDLKKSSIQQSKLRKSSFQTPSKQLPTVYHPQIQEQLRKLDLYLGDRKTEQKYEGTKKQGVRWGKGRLQYINGLVYQGDFKDNLRHGYGTLTLNGKKIYEGEWQRDKLCGKGTLWSVQFVNKRKLPDDSILRNCTYDGCFDNNQFQGQGSLYLTNGDKIVGLFNGGILCEENNYSQPTGDKEISIF